MLIRGCDIWIANIYANNIEFFFCTYRLSLEQWLECWLGYELQNQLYRLTQFHCQYHFSTIDDQIQNQRLGCISVVFHFWSPPVWLLTNIYLLVNPLHSNLCMFCHPVSKQHANQLKILLLNLCSINCKQVLQKKSLQYFGFVYFIFK